MHNIIPSKCNENNFTIIDFTKDVLYIVRKIASCDLKLKSILPENSDSEYKPNQ